MEGEGSRFGAGDDQEVNIAPWMVSKAASSAIAAREAGEAAAAQLASSALLVNKAIEAASSAFAASRAAEAAAVAAESTVSIVGVRGLGDSGKEGVPVDTESRMAAIIGWLKAGLEEAVQSMEYFSKRLKEVSDYEHSLEEADSEEAVKFGKVLGEVADLSNSLNEASHICKMHLIQPQRIPRTNSEASSAGEDSTGASTRKKEK